MIPRKARTDSGGRAGSDPGKAEGPCSPHVGRHVSRGPGGNAPPLPPTGCRGPSSSPASPSEAGDGVGVRLHCRLSHERGMGCSPTSPSLRAGSPDQASAVPAAPLPHPPHLSVRSQHTPKARRVVPGGRGQAGAGPSCPHLRGAHAGLLPKVTTLEATLGTPRPHLRDVLPLLVLLHAPLGPQLGTGAPGPQHGPAVCLSPTPSLVPA